MFFFRNCPLCVARDNVCRFFSSFLKRDFAWDVYAVMLCYQPSASRQKRSDPTIRLNLYFHEEFVSSVKVKSICNTGLKTDRYSQQYKNDSDHKKKKKNRVLKLLRFFHCIVDENARQFQNQNFLTDRSRSYIVLALNTSAAQTVVMSVKRKRTKYLSNKGTNQRSVLVSRLVKYLKIL